MKATLGFRVVVPAPVSILSRHRAVRTANRVITLGNQRMERELMLCYKGIPFLPGDIQQRIEFQDIAAHFKDVREALWSLCHSIRPETQSVYFFLMLSRGFTLLT